MAEVTVTLNNFENEVLKAEKPVLVDFWASWCGPCRMLAPVVEEIDKEYGDKIKVCKVNVDDEPELADRFKINAIPTILVFKNGEIVNKSMGYKKKEDLLKLF
ncbi:MAG: thioredoxin [Clostridia bacterium]|nr:thioredoxin [Clostridia bacterium]